MRTLLSPLLLVVVVVLVGVASPVVRAEQNTAAPATARAAKPPLGDDGETNVITLKPSSGSAKPAAGHLQAGLDIQQLAFGALAIAQALTLGLLIWQQIQLIRVGSLPRGGSSGGRGPRPTIADAVARLDDRLSTLERNPPPRNDPTPRQPAPREPTPHPPVLATAPRPQRTDPQPAPPAMLDQAQVVYQPPEPQLPPQPALSDILQAYREAASARSRQRLSVFVREYGAIGLRPSGGPETLLLVDDVDTEPMLFGIEIGRGRLAVFPGNDIVVGFATIYASQRNIPAEVSVAYQLEVDGSRIFRLIEPSIWTQAGADTYRRQSFGTIGGLND